MARPRKPAEQRADNRSDRVPKRDLRVVPPMDVPAPPAGMCPAVLDWWAEIFETDLGRVTLTSTDIDALRRLAQYRNKLVGLCEMLADAEVAVVGSKGQPVLHPIYRALPVLEKQVMALEDRFGLSPRARLNLGIQLGAARRSLEDLIEE